MTEAKGALDAKHEENVLWDSDPQKYLANCQKKADEIAGLTATIARVNKELLEEFRAALGVPPDNTFT